MEIKFTYLLRTTNGNGNTHTNNSTSEQPTNSNKVNNIRNRVKEKDIKDFTITNECP